MPFFVSTDRIKLGTALAALARFVRGGDAENVAASCVHVIAQGGRLHLSAASVDMSAETIVHATIEHEAQLLVPAAPFRDAVTGCQGPRITLRLQGATRTLRVEGDATYVDLLVPEVSDTPPVPTVDVAGLRPVEDGFRDLLEATVYAASKDESRPHLCGVRLQAYGRHFCATATNGHRLARMRAPASLFFEEWEITLRREAAKILLALPGDVTGVGICEGRFVAVVGGITMTVRPVEGEYPNADLIIPTERQSRVVVDRVTLLAACKAAERFATKEFGISLVVAHDQMRVACKSPMVGVASWDLGVSTLDRVTPPPWVTALQPGYLAEALRAMDGSERVTIAFNGSMTSEGLPAGPCTIEDRGGGRLALIMCMSAEPVMDLVREHAPQPREPR